MSKVQGYGRGMQAPTPVMPGFVKSALASRKLTETYDSRPEYQRHGYLKWINEARLKDTQKKRMAQMLDELEKGGVYQGEPWTPPPPVVKE